MQRFISRYSLHRTRQWPYPRRFYSTPGKIKVNIKTQDSTELDYESPTGMSLMRSITDVAMLDMTVSCEGCMKCSMCHVYVSPEWYARLPPPSETELDLLDAALDVKDTSRLSCQLTLSEELDGIAVELPKHVVDLVTPSS